MNVIDKVKEFAAETYNVDVQTLTAETHFEYDLDDSLQIVELILKCEEFFDIELLDEEVEATDFTIGGLTALIENKLRDKPLLPGHLNL